MYIELTRIDGGVKQVAALYILFYLIFILTLANRQIKKIEVAFIQLNIWFKVAITHGSFFIKKQFVSIPYN